MKRAAHAFIGRSFAATAMVAALLLLAPSTASACSGSRLQGETGSLEDGARAIFTGTVVRRDDGFDWLTGGFNTYEWTFAVDDVERGEIGERITVQSPQSSASCGVNLELGARYRVLAYDAYDGPGLEIISNDATEVEPLANPPRIEVIAIGHGWTLIAILTALPFLVAALIWLGSRRPHTDDAVRR